MQRHGLNTRRTRQSAPARQLAGLLTMCILTFAFATSHAGQLKIAATTGDLASIAAEVGGEYVSVDVLTAPNQDTHYADPRPSIVVTLSRVDLLLAVGLDLEIGWLPPLLVNSRNRAIQPGASGFFEAGRHVHVLHGESRDADRSLGDVHPDGNPHFTTDPARQAQVARALATRLGELDPEHADAYRDNASAFVHRALALRQAQREQFAALPEEARRLVIYHESFAYVLDWLNLETIATIEPLPGVEPNPRHVATVLERARARHARAILQESWYPSNVAATLSSLLDIPIVVLDGQTDFEAGENVIDHTRDFTNDLFRALNGEGAR